VIDTLAIENAIEREMAGNLTEEDIESALLQIEDAAAVSAGEQQLVAGTLATAADMSEELTAEDIAIASSMTKIVEDSRCISEDEKAIIQDWKLSKSELKALVPEDWDAINIDWFASNKEESVPLPEFRLNLLWSDKNIAIAVDQVYSRGQVSPLTEYFFWPRKDAWDELKNALEQRNWINQRDKIVLLNRLTEVINFWQNDDQKPTIEQARAAFPDCSFTSA
jgi:30S ribosomal protein 3